VNYILAERATGAGRRVVAVDGELDMTAAPRLRAAIEAAIDAGALTVVIDLNEVTFIDSTAIGVLLAARERIRRSGGSFEVVCGEPNVVRVLEMVGMRVDAGAR
jgi:anti-sigma B factor antagonist